MKLSDITILQNYNNTFRIEEDPAKETICFFNSLLDSDDFQKTVQEFREENGIPKNGYPSPINCDRNHYVFVNAFNFLKDDLDGLIAAFGKSFITNIRSRWESLPIREKILYQSSIFPNKLHWDGNGYRTPVVLEVLGAVNALFSHGVTPCRIYPAGIGRVLRTRWQNLLNFVSDISLLNISSFCHKKTC